MANNYTYLASASLTITSSVTASIQCWGAGGHGNTNGTGGSGAAFASSSIGLVAGSTYFIYVGKTTSGDGAPSSFGTGSVTLVKAPGGYVDGTVSKQLSLLTGSIRSQGGQGGVPVPGIVHGGGGGSSGHPNSANGSDGAANATIVGASYSTAGMHPNQSHTATNPRVNPENPPAGGAAPTSGSGNGGTGAWYDSSTRSIFYPATAGSVPGGGGGGHAKNNATDISAPGGNGMIIITY